MGPNPFLNNIGDAILVLVFSLFGSGVVIAGPETEVQLD